MSGATDRERRGRAPADAVGGATHRAGHGRAPADAAGGRAGRAERGAVSIEVAVLAPAFIALIVLAGVAGRTAVADEAVASAAHDAARAASISRDARTARAAATDAAHRQLDWQGLDCTGAPSLAFTGSVRGRSTTFEAAFRSPAGQPATVSVRVTCTVSFADIRLPLLPGMPTGNTVTATFTSPLDRYRSRALAPTGVGADVRTEPERGAA